MLNTSTPPTIPSRRTHRTYTAQFKADLVAQCLRPGVSIVALAGKHGMNVNVLHRWLREYERQGAHRPSGLTAPPPTRTAAIEFVPVQLPSPACAEGTDQRVSIELRKGALTLTVSWRWVSPMLPLICLTCLTMQTRKYRCCSRVRGTIKHQTQF